MKATITDISPTDIASGDSPMAIRSQGLMPELPVVKAPAAEIDVWALAARLARANERVVMRATVEEIRALAAAVLDLTAGLVSVGATDRSAPYGETEARPDGQLPPEGERWRTPREIAEQIIRWEAPKP